jgi:Mn2+/Fe2+ NRAMP family transporter
MQRQAVGCEAAIAAGERRPEVPSEPASARAEELGAGGLSAKRLLGALGGGLIAGASDTDPTTVATLSVVGAATIYGLSWLVLLILPMLLVVQVVSARVGLVSRRGLETLVREQYGRGWAWIAMLLVVGVDLFTIGADLEGGAAALELLTGLSWRWLVVPLAIGVGALLVVSSYEQIQKVLRYVLIALAAYVGAAFLARPDWSDVLRQTLIPTMRLTPDFTTAALAMLGTTLTSYVYVWQTIEEREERQPIGKLPLVELDAAAGIVFAVLLFWFILVSTGATLGVQGKPVQTAQDAAQALGPIAGPFAGSLFAAGLLASSLLALPILASTTGYVAGAAFGWRCGLSEPVGRATGPFYAVVLGSLAFGAALSIVGVEPIQLLFLAGIVGGLGTPLLLALLLLLARSREVMGEHRIPGIVSGAGWLTAIVVSLAGAVYLAQQLPPIS